MARDAKVAPKKCTTCDALAADNDVLSRALASIGHKLEAAYARIDQFQQGLAKVREGLERVIANSDSTWATVSELTERLAESEAARKWLVERDAVVSAALKKLNTYTTDTTVQQWENQHPRPAGA